MLLLFRISICIFVGPGIGEQEKRMGSLLGLVDSSTVDSNRNLRCLASGRQTTEFTVC